MKVTLPVEIEGSPGARWAKDAQGRWLFQVPGPGKGGWHNLLRITPAQGTASTLEFAGTVTGGVDIDGSY